MADSTAKIDNDILRRILEIFREELSLRTVEPNDDFFDLGGDSLMAENLVTAINSEYEWSYDVSNIMDYPTPLAFAGDLSEGLTKNDIIKIVPGCTGTEPFLFLHGAFGGNYQLRYLGEEIRKHWNFIGVRALGMVAGEKPNTSLDEMINTYLTRSQKQFGTYPRIMGGNCAGGLLALELARKIYERTGQRITVILLDPPGTFLRHQTSGKGQSRFETPALDRSSATFSRLCNHVLVRLGLGNSKPAQNARRNILFRNIRKFSCQIYPDPFPCNILAFVGTRFMDVSFPGLQAWATDEVVLRGIPLAGNHTRIYEKNIQLIDQEILAFVDELKSKNLYSEAL